MNFVFTLYLCWKPVTGLVFVVRAGTWSLQELNSFDWGGSWRSSSSFWCISNFSLWGEVKAGKQDIFFIIHEYLQFLLSSKERREHFWNPCFSRWWRFFLVYSVQIVSSGFFWTDFFCFSKLFSSYLKPDCWEGPYRFLLFFWGDVIPCSLLQINEQTEKY